ncbi:MAG: hypothetical protein AAF208_06605 [Cyanobacteria bacterium P01_A01_bin.45]
MKISNDGCSILLKWAYRCCKYFFFGTIGFLLFLVVSGSIVKLTIPMSVVLFMANIFLRLGMVCFSLLGMAIFWESWK